MRNSPEIVVCQIPSFERPDTPEILRQIKESGVTSVQIYTFWKDFEPDERGKFEWDYFDRQVRMIQQAGLKYVPFILIGPKYASPDWWIKDENHVGLKCLEHGKENPIESIWNPLLRDEVDRVLKAFAEHYLPWGVLESVQPGICGDYGESIMPVHGNWPGAYHTHPGYWIGGDDAVASFRQWLGKKYSDIKCLNKSWRTSYTAFEEINTFLPHKTPSRTALIDEFEWYRESMTDFVDFWMAACRKYFPDTPVYMCTGGTEEPEHASLFSEQAKACARHGGGIRLTNEGNKFFENFFLTSYTHSACEFYGAYLGLEPVGPMTPEGVTARMFGSGVYGNKQMFYYYGNIFRVPDEKNPSIYDDRTRRFKEHLHLINECKSECELAFFWPSITGAVQGSGIPEGMSELVTHIRKSTAIMPVNDYMVADGALDSYKLLIMPINAFTKREVLLKIRDWVLGGGILFAVGRMTDLELESVPEYDELFGILPESEITAGGIYYSICGGKFKEFSQAEGYHSRKGWLNLHPEIIPLSKCEKQAGYSGTEIPEGYNAFMREFPSGGAAIAYFGPVNFDYDSQSIDAQKPVFPALVSDLINTYTNSPELSTAPGEVARGNIKGKLYALCDGGEIREINCEKQ